MNELLQMNGWIKVNGWMNDLLRMNGWIKVNGWMNKIYWMNDLGKSWSLNSLYNKSTC